MLGEKLKELRESKGLLQRQIAAELEVDTAYISKMENNEKPVSLSNLKALEIFYNLPEGELMPFLLAEKITQILNKSPWSNQALNLVLKSLQTDE